MNETQCNSTSNNLDNVKFAKKWIDGEVVKYRYDKTNLIFEVFDGIIYIHDIDDVDLEKDLLRDYANLKEVLIAYNIPIEEFQSDFRDCEVDSSCSMWIYDVNTLNEV